MWKGGRGDGRLRWRGRDLRGWPLLSQQTCVRTHTFTHAHTCIPTAYVIFRARQFSMPVCVERMTHMSFACPAAPKAACASLPLIALSDTLRSAPAASTADPSAPSAPAGRSSGVLGSKPLRLLGGDVRLSGDGASCVCVPPATRPGLDFVLRAPVLGRRGRPGRALGFCVYTHTDTHTHSVFFSFPLPSSFCMAACMHVCACGGTCLSPLPLCVQ